MEIKIAVLNITCRFTGQMFRAVSDTDPMKCLINKSSVRNIVNQMIRGQLRSKAY